MATESKGGAAASTPPPAGDNMELVARLGAQRSKFKNAAKALTTERDNLRTENQQLKDQIATLTTKADGSAMAKRVAELEQQLRERDHRAVFDRVAKARGVPEDSYDLVYQLSGYKAEGDQPDETAIGALLDEAKARPGLSRLFGQADAGAATSPTDPGNPPPIVRPAVGSGQGRPAGSPVVMAADDPRHSDVRYMWENFDQISAAAQERVKRGEI